MLTTRYYMLFYSSVALLLICIVGVLQVRPRKSKTNQVAVVTLKDVRVYSPKSGEILSSVFNRAFISSQSSEKIIKTLQKINFNFKTIKPSDTMKFFYENDTLVKIEYKKDYKTIYCIDGFEKEIYHRDTEDTEKNLTTPPEKRVRFARGGCDSQKARKHEKENLVRILCNLVVKNKNSVNSVPSSESDSILLKGRPYRSVVNNPKTLKVAMVYKNIIGKVNLVKGEIEASLYESMLNIGEKPVLIANYADVLAWEVDFFTETQTGDSFFVLVEKKYDEEVCVDYGRILAVRYKGKIGDFSGYYFIDATGYKDYYDKDGKSLRKAFLKSPMRYSQISSYFSGGRYHPILKIVRPHNGIDYVAPSGTPVSAIGSGTVTFAGWRGGYGRLVEIVHAQRFKSRYGHLRSFGKGIRKGQRVVQGQILGYVGTTGLSTGPHLHFELLKNGSWVNPLKIIPPRAEPVKPEYFSDFVKQRDSLMQYFYH